MEPPATVTLPDGTELDLLPLARQISDAHLARHPDELEQYGEAARDWCTHDNQHLLSWAALDLDGGTYFDDQLRWLSRVLVVTRLRSRAWPTTCGPGDDRQGHARGASVQALADRLALAGESLDV